jgi:hypothetical protein
MVCGILQNQSGYVFTRPHMESSLLVYAEHVLSLVYSENRETLKKGASVQVTKH